jgi:hypothetical protein
MTVKAKMWLHGLFSGFITGVSTGFLSALGITGANMVGVKMEQLQPKQLMVLTVMGGVVGAMSYLKQSPLPPEDNSDPSERPDQEKENEQKS